MAESYRGLTIRIGADTSKLSYALKAATTAMSTAQNQATRLKRALALDPGNTGAISQYIKAIGDKADDAAMKLSQLENAYSQVGKQSSKSNPTKTIKQLSEETDNAAQSAGELLQRYHSVETELAKMYTSLTAMSKKWMGEEDGNVFNAENSDIDDIRAEYEMLVEMGALTQKEADKAISKIEKLKATFEQVSNAYDDAKNVAKLKDTEVEITSTDAAMKSLNRTFADVNASSLKSVDDVIGNLATVADDTAARFKIFDDAFKVNPANLIAAIARMKALREATSASKSEADKLREAIKTYESAGIDKLASQTKNAEQSAKESREAYADAREEVVRLTGKLEESKQTVNLLKEKQQAYGNAWVAANKGVKEYSEQLTIAEDRAEELRVESEKADAVNTYQKLKDKLVEVQTEYRNLKKEASITASLGQVGSSALLLAEQLGQYAQQAGRKVIDLTVDLDTAYTSVKKTVDATEEEYQALYDAAVASSRVQPVDAATILNIEALGGQLGFAASEVEKFSEVVSGLEVSTNMDWESAGTNMAQFANIMQMSHDDVDKYGAAIVELGNNFATTESDISDMALRIAGAGASLGMSEADVLGLSAALTSMGLTAEAGGSSISRIMTNIDKSVGHGFDGVKLYAEQAGLSLDDFLAKVAEGGDWAKEFAEQNEMTLDKLVSETKDSYDSLEVWADTAGYKTVDEFAAAWKDPNRGPIKVLEDVFSGMEKSVEDGSNLAILLDDLGVSSIRTQDVARRLASNSKLLSEAVDSSNAAWEENIALETEVERRNDSLSGRFEVLNNLTAVATELGEGLNPMIVVGIDLLSSMADAMSEMPDSAKTTILGVLGGLTGVAVLSPIVRGLASNITGLVTGLVSLAASITTLPLVQDAVLNLGIAFETLGAGSIAAGAAAAGGLALIGWAIYDVWQQNEKARQKQEDFNAALERVDGIAVSASDAVDKYKSGTKALPQYLKEAATRTEELTKRLNEYADAVNELDQNSNDEVLQLQLYQDALDELAGHQDLDAEQKAKLQWALDGINESLGTNITLEEAMAGNYKNEEGEIEGVTEALDALITKRQEEARLKANEDTYTKALELNNEMQSAYRDSQEALTEYVDAMREQAKAQGLYTNEEEFLAMLEKGSADYRELKANAENAGEAAKKASEEVTEASNLMANDQSWSEFGFDVGDVRQKMEELGLSSEDLATITVSDFRKMAKGAGGNIDTLMQNIIDYNRLKMEGKNPTIDANGNVISGEAQRQLELTQKRIDTLSGKDVTARVTGNAVDGTAASAILDTVKAIAQLTASSAVAYVKAVVGGSFESGALRYHADGFIANNYGKGVAISSHDIVGENGAEAIIPLTNKRYTRPFADTVAEQMLDRMGNMQQGGDTYIIEKLEVPAGSALADAMSTVFDMALREAKA